MTVRTKVLGAAMASAVVLAAGSASALVVLPPLTFDGVEYSASVTSGLKGPSISQIFEFMVPASLGTLDAPINISTSLSDTTGSFASGTLSLYSSLVPSPATLITSAPLTGDFVQLSPESLGKGAYYIDVKGTIVGKTAKLTASAFTDAIPEPATWAVMLIGFGGVGASMRNARRKQAAATA